MYCHVQMHETHNVSIMKDNTVIQQSRIRGEKSSYGICIQSRARKLIV